MQSKKKVFNENLIEDFLIISKSDLKPEILSYLVVSGAAVEGVVVAGAVD